MSREQVIRAIDELEVLMSGTLDDHSDGDNIIGGGGPRKRKPGRPKKRMYGSGLMLEPAPFGYGRSNIGGRNIGGCNMYGGADDYYMYGGADGPGKGNRTGGADRKGGRKAENWADPRYGIRESSKLFNRLLNKYYKENEEKILKAGYKNKTLWKISQAEQLNNPKQRKYMIDKYEIGMENIGTARDVLAHKTYYCENSNLRYAKGITPTAQIVKKVRHPGKKLAPAPIFQPVERGLGAPSRRGKVAYYPTAYIH